MTKKVFLSLQMYLEYSVDTLLYIYGCLYSFSEQWWMFTLVTYLPLSFVMHIWIKRRCGGGVRFIIMWPPSSAGSEKSISRYPFEACLFVFLTELTTSRWQHIYANWGIFLTHLIFFKPVTTDQMRLSYESQCSELGGTVPHTFQAFIFMWGAECYIRSEHCFTSLFLLTGPDNKNKGPPAGYCGMSGRTAVWY